MAHKPSPVDPSRGDRKPPVDLPNLEALLDRIQASLARRRQLGVVSVAVLPDHASGEWGGWSAYETVRREIARFLLYYRRERMRREDRLYGPGTSGNAFILLLDAPRHGRALSLGDVRRFQHRLRLALREHLHRVLPRDVLDAFGCYVGGSILCHQDRVAVERLVYRGLEEAFADSLRDKRRQHERHRIQLRRILRTGLVNAVYQPVLDLVQKSVLGYEALTRLPNNTFGPMDRLFKAAQDFDVLWNLERLCRRKAVESVPPLERRQLLFLNIEPASLRDPELRDATFHELLRCSGLEPQRVVLEMTEHSAVADFSAFRSLLDEFRSQGFRLAMDDVGSGYAGLQAIAEIAPEFIKADMSLVRDVHRHPVKRELLSTMRRFAEATGTTLIAEGVETLDELRVLQDLGIPCAQGYLFSRPSRTPKPPDWSLLASPTDRTPQEHG